MSLVVGYDGGESSRKALTVAVGLARDLAEPLYVVCGVAPAGGMGEEYGATEDAVVEALAPLVNEAVVGACAQGIDAHAMLVDADPVAALATAAEQHQPRLLVIGNGSSGRIRAALFGAVAPRMIERSEVPVLVVP